LGVPGRSGLSEYVKLQNSSDKQWTGPKRAGHESSSCPVDVSKLIQTHKILTINRLGLPAGPKMMWDAGHSSWKTPHVPDVFPGRLLLVFV